MVLLLLLLFLNSRQSDLCCCSVRSVCSSRRGRHSACRARALVRHSFAPLENAQSTFAHSMLCALCLFCVAVAPTTRRAQRTERSGEPLHHCCCCWLLLLVVAVAAAASVIRSFACDSLLLISLVCLLFLSIFPSLALD